MSLLPILNDIQPDLPNNMTCCISAKVSCAAVAMDAKALAGWKRFTILRPHAWLIGLSFSLPISIFIHFLHTFDRIAPRWSSQARCFLLHRQIDKLPPSLMITLNDDHKVRSVYSVVDFKGKRCPQQQKVENIEDLLSKQSAKYQSKVLSFPAFNALDRFSSFVVSPLVSNLLTSHGKSSFTQISTFPSVSILFHLQWNTPKGVQWIAINQPNSQPFRLSIALMAISFTWYYVKWMLFFGWVGWWCLCVCCVFILFKSISSNEIYIYIYTSIYTYCIQMVSLSHLI